MADNIGKSGLILTTATTSKQSTHIWTSFLVVLSLLLLINCNSKGNTGKDIMFKDSDTLATKWEQVFEQDEIINFTFDSPDMELYTLGDMMVTPDDEYIIIDGKVTRVNHFDKDGKFIRTIGAKGEGPGEFTIPCLPFMDKEKNLYIYDIQKYRLNKYLYPDFKFEKTIKMPLSVQNYFLDNQENLIVYATSDHNILHKINLKGESIKKTFQPVNIQLRAFLGRFHLGRVADVPGKGFVCVYPEEYKIHLYDYQLNLKRTFSPASVSRFFPPRLKFPGHLNPHAFSPEHAKWWNETLKLSRTFCLENGIIIQEMAEYVKMSAKLYVNIHDLQGRTLAVGLELPFEGMIQSIHKNQIYALEFASFDEKGNVVPLKLHRFQMKKSTEE